MIEIGREGRDESGDGRGGRRTARCCASAPIPVPQAALGGAFSRGSREASPCRDRLSAAEESPLISATVFAFVVVPALCLGLGLAGYAWTRLSAGRLDRARAGQVADAFGETAGSKNAEILRRTEPLRNGQSRPEDVGGGS